MAEAGPPPGPLAELGYAPRVIRARDGALTADADGHHDVNICRTCRRACGQVPLHIASTVRTSDTANWLENRRRSSSCSSIPPMRGTETHNKFEITPWRAGVAAGIEE